MKYSIIYLLVLVGGITVISSCGKGFLDVPPTNSINAPDAIKTAADARIIVNGIMRNMTDANYYGRNFLMYGDAKEEILFYIPRAGDQMHCTPLTIPPILTALAVSGLFSTTIFYRLIALS